VSGTPTPLTHTTLCGVGVPDTDTFELFFVSSLISLLRIHGFFIESGAFWVVSSVSLGLSSFPLVQWVRRNNSGRNPANRNIIPDRNSPQVDQSHQFDLTRSGVGQEKFDFRSDRNFEMGMQQQIAIAGQRALHFGLSTSLRSAWTQLKRFPESDPYLSQKHNNLI
jgi:hypothetical protein